MNPYVILDEKNKGDQEIIQSHLEDIAIDCSRLGNTMVVTDYGFDYYKQGELTIYLEPLRPLDHPSDYYVIMENLKRKISYLSSYSGGLLEVVVEPKRWWKRGKHTRLFILPKKRPVEEKR